MSANSEIRDTLSDSTEYINDTIIYNIRSADKYCIYIMADDSINDGHVGDSIHMIYGVQFGTILTDDFIKDTLWFQRQEIDTLKASEFGTLTSTLIEDANAFFYLSDIDTSTYTTWAVRGAVMRSDKRIGTIMRCWIRGTTGSRLGDITITKFFLEIQ